MDINPSSIETHYYKIGHIKTVHYAIYHHESDQSLLELELTIRHKFPKILVTYYNKCLYYFKLGSSVPQDDVQQGFDVEPGFDAINHEKVDMNELDQWPLTLITKGMITVEAIANPKPVGSSSTHNAGQTKDEPNEAEGRDKDIKEATDTFLSVSLLKAIKKSIIYNLCQNPQIRIFGNYLIFNRFKTNHIVYLDSIVLSNGNILLSAIENHNLNLYDSNILRIHDLGHDELNSNFVIYLIPSGIRCHLFDSLKILNSFTTTPPKNVDTIKELVKLSTRQELKSGLWVKLLPNLQHLNNQTSKISKFIHGVDNKKYILWPWDLCVLQFGKYEPDQGLDDLNTDDDDLLNKFMDFKIDLSNDTTINEKFDEFDKFFDSELDQNQNLPLDNQNYNLLNMDMDIDLDLDVSHDQLHHELNDHKLDDKLHHDSGRGDHEIDNVVDQHDKGDGEDDDEEDLFGGDSEPELEPEPESPNQAQNQNKLQEFNQQQDNNVPIPGDPGAVEGEDLFDFLPMDHSIFDIPRDQMTYDDPGAPLPIIPTPLAPPPPDKGELSFSPIVFNPLIKSNIDTKYGKGGKFYVDKKGEGTPKLRATSVSGVEIRKDIASNTSAIGLTGSAIDSGDENDEVEDEDEDDQEESGSSDEDDNLSTPLKLNDLPFHSQPPHRQILGSATSILAPNDPLVAGGYSTSVNHQLPHQIPNNANHSFTEEEKSEPMVVPGGSSFSSPNLFMSNKLTSLSKFESPFSPDRLKFSPLDTDDFKSKAGTSMPANMNLNMNQMTPIFTPAGNNVLNSNLLGSAGLGTTPGATPFSSIGIGLGMTAPTASILNNGTGTGIGVHGNNSANANANLSSNLGANASGNTINGVITGNTGEESSNCLPLILRGINVSTIPEEYLLNNIAGAIKFSPSASDFEMVDDEDDDELFKKSEMVVNNVEFMDVLVPNLVFDLGLNEFNFVTSLPEYSVANNDDTTNTTTTTTTTTDVVFDGLDVGKNIEEIIQESFTGYRVKLDEFLSDMTTIETDQFSFLDDLTSDEVYPKSKLKKLETIEWDTFGNLSYFHKYMDIITEINDNKVLDVNNSIKTLPETKIIVKKSGEVVNLNSPSLKFWKFLNFEPMSQKNFKVVLISEIESDILNLLKYNYDECRLGTMEILQEIIIGHQDDYRVMYKMIIKRLESIKVETTDPILLLFINFNPKMNSILELCKISKHFNKGDKDVNVFVKILPSSAIFQHGRLKYLSNYSLSQINFNLYNLCPPNKLYTTIVRDPISKVKFKFYPKNDNDDSSDDAFLHLAYERSIDKQWFSVSWTDPTGLVTKTKSWKLGDLKQVSDEVFDISIELFKILNDDIISRTNGLGGKKFLILTRLNSVIPDDELVHWKRLSLKHKEILLIVLSVGSDTRNTFNDISVHHQQPPHHLPTNLQSINVDAVDAVTDVDTAGVSSMATALNTSTSNTGGGGNGNTSFSPFSPYSFLSPDPKEVNYKDMIVQESITLSLIPQAPVPSFNCPTRVGMKLGLLVKKLGHGYQVYEVNLLSCSNYWNPDNLMKLILNHYKKLCVLGEIMGVGSDLPWHISAVKKSLQYLTHIDVE